MGDSLEPGFNLDLWAYNTVKAKTPEIIANNSLLRPVTTWMI